MIKYCTKCLFPNTKPDLYFDEDGNLYTEDWDFSSTSASLKTLVDKVYYLRYGQPIDDLYFRIGALPKITMGHGILVKGYANNMDYPQVRRLGFDFRYTLADFRFEFIHSDLKEFSNAGLAVWIKSLNWQISVKLP